MKLEAVIDLEKVNVKLGELPAIERIRWAYQRFGTGIVSTTSGGDTSVVLPHLTRNAIPYNPPIVFVDIGYFRNETFEMVNWLMGRGYDVRTYSPKITRAEIDARDPSWFLKPESKEFEQIVQAIKHEPLDRAFAELQPRAWLRGIMHWETEERKGAHLIEFKRGIYQVHPILDWTEKQVFDYIAQNNLPRNQRHLDVTKGPDQALECGIAEVGLH
ncbi:phosphoadenosine phosphosulfate reductase family protein [Candidatus Woesearchaeota archaeon]|nr:phosphoadenosine phosphosulfate reductase family protein [Candidatus Woesearchaeota archaeon]